MNLWYGKMVFKHIAGIKIYKITHDFRLKGICNKHAQQAGIDWWVKNPTIYNYLYI